MTKLIDRMMIRGFFKSYVICLVSLLSLYIVVDLFTNLEDFAEKNTTVAGTLRHIATYYGLKISPIFDRLCEAIVVMASAFTVAWMQRNNELIPLLSAGMSAQRVVRPILLGACAMLLLSIFNQELIIPRIAIFLQNDRDDPYGDKDIIVSGAFEPNGVHVEGDVAVRKDLVVKKFRTVIPEHVAGILLNMSAAEAFYVPPEPGKERSGGWFLTKTTPENVDNWDNPILEKIDAGKWFLHTEEVNFDAVTRGRNWFVFASTGRLAKELCKADSARMAPMAVLFHMRLTRPLLGMILLLLSLAIILRDQNRNIFISAGLCLVLCGLFFAAQFVCKGLGDADYLSPALAAWLPVLFFGPWSLALFDAIHT